MEKLDSYKEYDCTSNVECEVKEKLSYVILKRIFDFISGLVALILLSPVFIVIGIWVALDSKGPIVFGHKRLGKDGKVIKVYKFRSMYENADELFKQFSNEQKAEFEKNFKLENDPRITRIGGFLRKTSLDELPQLWNTVKGDMSLVGPRPIVLKEVDKYGKYANKLFSVKPGLTGYWQANGRSDTSYSERVQMDMFYIDNRSLWLDTKILFKTVITVLKKDGAI